MKSQFWGMLFAILVGAGRLSAGAEPGKSAESAADKKPAASTTPVPSQEELEQKFADNLSGATLAGHFSVDGRAGAPSEDRYTISKVSKVEGETWKFEVRIVYGQYDVALPLLLTVKWAGDTPVITLTDFTIPGLGTYTARVLFYRGQYAGTWSASDHGGEMWGRIERPAAKAADDKSSGQKSEPAGSSSGK